MHIVTSTDILLPRAEDMGAWSVIACDQFTSEPEYWAAAEARAAEKPSTLSLMLPEAWLHTARADGADGRIADTMRRYLAEGVFQTVPDSFIYVERTLSDGRVRRGLVAALDLEQYDFTGTQRTSVRSTEGTVEERLPPRVNIRRGAPLEMPHTLLLMDDRTDSVLSLAEKAKDTLEKVYDFDLMLGGGHIAGWRVSGETKAAVQSALDALDNAALQREKYGDAAENGKLTFAVGDGNHSLAAAKRFWEEKRETLPENERETDPARFALVEIENIHEPSLDFEPIHRVIFKTEPQKLLAALKESCCAETGFPVKWYIGEESGTIVLDKNKGELAVGIHLKGGALALHAAQILNKDVVQAAVRAGSHGAAEAQLVADNAGKGGAQLLGLGQLHGAVVGAAGEADAHGQQGADEQDDENGAQQLRQGEAAAVTKLVHGATSS